MGEKLVYGDGVEKRGMHSFVKEWLQKKVGKEEWAVC